jgi:hypothetical protein
MGYAAKLVWSILDAHLKSLYGAMMEDVLEMKISVSKNLYVHKSTL